MGVEGGVGPDANDDVEPRLAIELMELRMAEDRSGLVEDCFFATSAEPVLKMSAVIEFSQAEKSRWAKEMDWGDQ